MTENNVARVFIARPEAPFEVSFRLPETADTHTIKFDDLPNTLNFIRALPRGTSAVIVNDLGSPVGGVVEEGSATYLRWTTRRQRDEVVWVCEECGSSNIDEIDGCLNCGEALAVTPQPYVYTSHEEVLS